jgi:hypothetical protein
MALMLGVVWIMQCSGPMPSVEQVTLRDPAQPGLPYEVDVRVRNRWRGHGEIQLTAQLVDASTGRRYEAQQTAALQPDEIIHVIVPVQADKGTYEAHVEADYPPR